jgi:cytochrome oxidase Cu insertion factor (SCO1/SenC/PrrC family)
VLTSNPRWGLDAGHSGACRGNEPAGRRGGWRGILLLSFAVAGGCGPTSAPRSIPSGGAAESGTPAPIAGRVDVDDETAVAASDVPFVLTDQDGESFDAASLRGKVWMGAIFFANCPGPCFRENQAVADILREIDDPDFMVVSLTCDPENDTPEALARYAERFEADPERWKFLTGDLAVIRDVGMRLFKLPVELGVHSERGVVFDREGRLRGGYHLLQDDRVAALKKLIRSVLDEPAVGTGGPP